MFICLWSSLATLACELINLLELNSTEISGRRQSQSLFLFEHLFYICCNSGCSGVNGFFPPRLRSEVIWNRVANLRGEPGRNIALDLLNEFHNNEFKGINMLTVFDVNYHLTLRYNFS